MLELLILAEATYQEVYLQLPPSMGPVRVGGGVTVIWCCFLWILVRHSENLVVESEFNSLAFLALSRPRP